MLISFHARRNCGTPTVTPFVIQKHDTNVNDYWNWVQYYVSARQHRLCQAQILSMHSPIPHMPTTRTSSGVVEETHAKIFDPLNIASLCADPHNLCKNVSVFMEKKKTFSWKMLWVTEMRRSSREIKKKKTTESCAVLILFPQPSSLLSCSTISWQIFLTDNHVIKRDLQVYLPWGRKSDSSDYERLTDAPSLLHQEACTVWASLRFPSCGDSQPLMIYASSQHLGTWRIM